MAALMSLACSHEHYAPCTRGDVCECDCHDKKPSALYQAREAAHAAVKEFDRNPNEETAAVASDALIAFIVEYREENRG